MQKWIIIAVIVIILILTTVIVLNVDIETEYTPETEIEETELRKTIISLYFLDKNTIWKFGSKTKTKFVIIIQI